MQKVPMLWFWMLMCILAIFLTTIHGFLGMALEIFCMFNFWIWWQIYSNG